MFSISTDSDQQDDAQFEVDEYLSFNDEEEKEDTSLLPPERQQKHFTLQTHTDHHGCIKKERRDNFIKSASKDCLMKIAFKTKSDIEILDDGYKWRKYGKKFVKNSPHPRNYYQCSNEGCNVKKRVERHREDSSYVITAYEGVHYHHAPSNATVNQRRPVSLSLQDYSYSSNGSTLQTLDSAQI
ncbi:probable WRKY transcription factor 75 isoform X2 [Dioscorea cayenensis subsp. rotundata]|uniref:Probable WRKY transcription factor 75 isoform X2 n=1 Tax=Dioscorea cayennensis subsp. rotundata TaxID=55577 RepID=A0AB40B2P4_DIOCR|nr:probable WRKY transcription factor 75 isoform X2 [Dioscorea cayenensis subsp. rotundata]